ncbi:hypothetical protein L6452_18134 [Arctium lappa]|uniref:Uncharacterized protein n=1 Tax=Arctium lappa TaxID=4217 RepID=A0ACB9C5I8_ARCLA|nr:hypothetical protein L6452_18134 [Arctium lappa]
MISLLEKQRVNIPSQSKDLEFLTEAEIEESVRAEKLIVDCQKDASLARKIQSSQVKDKKLKKKPVKVQTSLLREIEEERSKEHRVNDSSVDYVNCLHKKLPAITEHTQYSLKSELFLIISEEDSKRQVSRQQMFIAESKTKPLNKKKSTSDLMRISVKRRRLYLYAKEHEEKLQR